VTDEQREQYISLLCWLLWLYRGITKQASVIKIIVFWNATLCRLLDISEDYNCKS